MQATIRTPIRGQTVNSASSPETADYSNGILHGPSPEWFERIGEPSVELIIWKRSLATDLGHWIDALPIHKLPDARLLVKENDLLPALTSVLDAAGTPPVEMRDAFLKDVKTLATAFMKVMGSDFVDIRLETIHHDACWKFHRDNVAARLLTTYRGPGTEWVAPSHQHEALSQQKSYRGPIQQFPQHAVGLFKGSRGACDKGIVHRSPPIVGTGQTRLLLCLNSPSEASPDVWTPS